VQDSRSRITSKFPVASRLSRLDGFDHVIRADSIAEKQIKVHFVRNCKSHARLGIIASKKVLPRAVDRNRVKRIIRETFRHHNVKFCKMDMVVMIRRDFSKIVKLPFAGLEHVLSQVESKCAEL
jgi:ribonuclease P protein component